MNEDFETFLPESFDPGTQEGTSFNVVPVGTYVAQVTDACVMQPQSGDGYYVKLTWQITEGEYEGRYVWQNITFLHSKTQAVTIKLREQWSCNFGAIGTMTAADYADTHIHCPAMSIFGTSTDVEFWSVLQGSEIENGFFSRFLVLASNCQAPDQDPPVTRSKFLMHSLRGLVSSTYGAEVL